MRFTIFLFLSTFALNLYGQYGSTNIFEGSEDQTSGAVIFTLNKTDTTISYRSDNQDRQLYRDNITAVHGISFHTVKQFFSSPDGTQINYLEGGLGGYFTGFHGLEVLGKSGVGIKVANNSNYWPSINATNINGTGMKLQGEGAAYYGLHAINLTGIGISVESNDNNALEAKSKFAAAGYFRSEQSAGAVFYGGKGIAIELKTADSEYGVQDDDAVIITSDKAGSDLIVVANDAMAFHLDDDNNSVSSFAVLNGVNEEIFRLDENGNLTITGTYSPSSDVNRKEFFENVDPTTILEKVIQLPISTWQYKGESIKHLGPMAQDFYSSFSLGQGDKTISTVDADGVALSAIQALYKKNQAQELINDRQQIQIDALLSELKELRLELQASRKSTNK